MLGFPDGLVVRTLRFHCRGHGSIPVWGTVNKIPQAGHCGQFFFLKRKEGDAVVVDIHGAWYLGVLVPL